MQKLAGEFMAKSRYFTHVELNLTLIEGWARDGLTDEQIAKNLGIYRTLEMEFFFILKEVYKNKEILKSTVIYTSEDGEYMNINEKLEREYNLYYNENKNMLSKERKITIYNVLELEREQKLNQITKVENQEIGLMSITINVAIFGISMINLMVVFKDVFGIGRSGLILCFLFTLGIILIYLLDREKKKKNRNQERIKAKAENKKIEAEMVNISTKQLVIKRLLLEEDNIK